MAKSSAPPNGGTPHRMATRAKNATTRLGLPDVVGWNPDEPDRVPLPPAERREAAAAAKKADEAAAARQLALRDAAVVRAAQIEERTQEEDRAADHARRQPKRPTPKPRPRAAQRSLQANDMFDTSHSGGDSTPVPQIGAGPAGTSLDGDQAVQNGVHAAVDTEFIEEHIGDDADESYGLDGTLGVDEEQWLSEDELVNGEAESEASASEFEPTEDVEQDSEDGEGEGEVDVESPAKKKNRRQVKVHRADVTAARSGSAAIQKRKNVTSSMTGREEIDTASKKPKLAATPTGLRAGWNAPADPPATVSRLTSAPRARKPATTPSSVAVRSNAPTTPTPSLRKTSSVYTGKSASNVLARKDGGGAGKPSVARRTDNDTLHNDHSAEGSAVARPAGTAWRLECLNSDTSGTEDSFPADKLTDVIHVPPPSVVAVNHHPVGPSNANNRRRWATTDLAADMRRQFTQAFIPLIRATVSRLQPWYSLTMDERQTLFDRVFPTYNHVIEVNDIVYSLMNSRITEWQGKFAAAAMSVVEAHFVKAHIAEPEARASWCRVQLGTNVAALKAPFLWRVWEDGKKQGCFQGVLVLKTFGIVHIPVLQSIPLALRQGEAQGDAEMRPCGALILAVLAVERALRVWQTGSRIVGKGHAGNFSADNWGDKTVVSHGVAKPSTKVANMFARCKAS